MLAQEEQLSNQVFLGNCKDVLKKLPENSVQLTITSPPYRNAINYEMHASGNGGYYRGNADRQPSTKPRKPSRSNVPMGVSLVNWGSNSSSISSSRPSLTTSSNIRRTMVLLSFMTAASAP